MSTLKQERAQGLTWSRVARELAQRAGDPGLADELFWELSAQAVRDTAASFALTGHNDHGDANTDGHDHEWGPVSHRRPTPERKCEVAGCNIVELLP